MRCAVIGGGASGLVFAVSALRLAAERNVPFSVTIFEKNDRVGKKLLSTGNGRCNLLNTSPDKKNWFCEKDFAYPALEKYDAESSVSFFRSLGLYLKSDAEGRMYPLSNQAASVLDRLRFECARLGAQIITGACVETLSPAKGGFLIPGYGRFDRVVLSVGSKASVKDCNASSLLSSLGHGFVPVVPGLTRLVTSSSLPKKADGVRAAAALGLFSDKGLIHEETGELMFSGGCLSGICSMQLSSFAAHYYRENRSPLTVKADLVPTLPLEELRSAVAYAASVLSPECGDLLTGFLPRKLGTALVKEAGYSPSMSASDLGPEDIMKICRLCKGYLFPIEKSADFSKAQIAVGGAVTDEFDPRTMQSKLIPGLYCCGEVLDVDGLCGGFNLMWAVSSARCAADAAVR